MRATRLLWLCLLVVPVAAHGQELLFEEGWEAGTIRWRTVDGTPVNVLTDTNICSTSFQRESIPATQGRVIGTTGIPVSAGQTYCVTAWIRSTPGAGPLLGINQSSANGTITTLFDEHWLIGRAGVRTGYQNQLTVTPVSEDGQWHWYSSLFVPEQGWTHVVLKDQVINNANADFDDIRLYHNGCPGSPTGAAHIPCGGSTPACTTDGRCVQCTQNTNCQSGYTCNTQTNVCIQCTSDAQCGGGSAYCDIGRGICVGCLSNGHCGGSTPYCDPLRRNCVGCLNNGNCGGLTPYCDNFTGTCVGCTSDLQCSGGTPACDKSRRTCVGCTSNAYCGGTTPVCNLVTQTCSGCTTNADCGGLTPICDTQRKGCVGCLSSSDCKGATPLCDLKTQQCVGCTSDADCSGSTPVCSPVTRVCVAGCKVDADCPMQTPACQPTRVCGYCSATNTTLCTGATPICDTAVGVCVPCQTGTNQGCTTSPDGRTCLTQTGVTFCGCTSDAECGGPSSGRVCDTGGTRRCIDGCSPAPGRNGCAPGQFCSTDDLTGKVIGTCSATCRTDAECARANPALPYCQQVGGTTTCVACRTNVDCRVAPRYACDTSRFTCVECTADADCGDRTSGRICDRQAQTCVAGCRGTGNGCQPGLVCSSVSDDPGMCRSVRVTGGGCSVGSIPPGSPGVAGDAGPSRARALAVGSPIAALGGLALVLLIARRRRTRR